MLNAQWLETFRMLCKTGHFTRTAAILGMTQPGVSQHIKKLEAQVGQALIARQGKSFVKTAAGEAVYAFSQRRYDEERSLQDTLAHDRPDVGKVAIACSGTFAMLLHPAIMALMKDAPELVIHLEAMPQDTIVQAVLEERIDLGIVHHDPQHARLNSTSLGVEEICLVTPDADLALPVTLQALQDLGFISHPDGGNYADELLGRNFPESYQGFEQLNLRSYINQINQIPEPVANGIGYTILPRSGVDTYGGPGRLRVHPLPIRHHHALWLVSRKLPKTPARVEKLTARIQDVATQLEAGAL